MSRLYNTVYNVIKSVKPKVGSLKERRDQFEDVVKRTGKHKQGLTDEGKVEISKTVQPVAKKISKLMDKKDELTKAAKKRKELKFGSKPKNNVQKIQETFGSKDKVPNKYKGFSKLPEAVQQKINKKLAKKV